MRAANDDVYVRKKDVVIQKVVRVSFIAGLAFLIPSWPEVGVALQIVASIGVAARYILS